MTILAETSVHAGTGSQLGAVDLPIQRERHTEWPTLYGTGIKGVLRDEVRRLKEPWSEGTIAAVFGPDTDKGERSAGALAISDARLLLFPVRTVGYAFAWITCPLAIARFVRDAGHAGITGVPAILEQPTADRIVVSDAWSRWKEGVFLEEFSYEATGSQGLKDFGTWIGKNLMPTGDQYNYWQKQVAESLSVVRDDDFRDFVRHGTEVVTRVKLEDEKKTVAQGMLWTEEHLPSDSLLYSFVAAWTPALKGPESPGDSAAVIGSLEGMLQERPVVQVGGKETVGHGFVALRLTGQNGGGHA
jgi:CRISPR-associated protein Cmr4